MYGNFMTYGYYMNKIIEENKKISESEYKKIRKNLDNLINRQSEICKSVFYKEMQGKRLV